MKPEWLVSLLLHGIIFFLISEVQAPPSSFQQPGVPLAFEVSLKSTPTQKAPSTRRPPVKHKSAHLETSFQTQLLTAPHPSTDAGTGQQDLIKGYVVYVQKLIQNELRYPHRMSERKKLSTRARLRVEIKNTGELGDLKILESSGNSSIDENLLEQIRGLGRFQAFETSFAHLASLTFTIPIVFQLR